MYSSLFYLESSVLLVLMRGSVEVKLFASHQSLVIATSNQLLVASYQSIVTSYQSLVVSHELLINTSHQFLVDNVFSRKDTCQGYSRKMFGGVLRLLMSTFVRKLKKRVFFTYLIHMFKFKCFRSSHKKLLYICCSLISKQISVKGYLQTSVKSSVLVKLLYTYSSTKDKLPLKYFIRKIIQKKTSNS